MKFIASVLLCLALVGCGTTGPKLTGTQVVNVPIATKCEPTLGVTEIKDHPKDRMKKDMSLYEKLQLILAELKLVEGQNKELTAALSECTK